jgi:uncharacterized membrane protein YeaQ/YmgE (transglycosylase-associated protein family)
MGLIELLILLVIAGICGVIAEFIVGFSPGGFVVSIVVGVIGAYLGSYLASLLGLPQYAPVSLLLPTAVYNFDMLWAVIGSILLVGLIKALRGTGRGRRRGRYF